MGLETISDRGLAIKRPGLFRAFLSPTQPRHWPVPALPSGSPVHLLETTNLAANCHPCGPRIHVANWRQENAPDEGGMILAVAGEPLAPTPDPRPLSLSWL